MIALYCECGGGGGKLNIQFNKIFLMFFVESWGRDAVIGLMPSIRIRLLLMQSLNLRSKLTAYFSLF